MKLVILEIVQKDKINNNNYIILTNIALSH